MKLFGIGAIPGAERAPEHYAFAAGQEHLRGADREAVVSSRIPSLVREADIADARPHLGELPWPSTVLVVRARGELPRDRCGVFETPLRLAVTHEEVAGRQCGLADNLRHDLVV